MKGSKILLSFAYSLNEPYCKKGHFCRDFARIDHLYPKLGEYNEIIINVLMNFYKQQMLV